MPTHLKGQNNVSTCFFNKYELIIFVLCKKMGNQEVSNKNHIFFALQGQMFGLVYQLSQVTLESQTQHMLQALY